MLSSRSKRPILLLSIILSLLLALSPVFPFAPLQIKEAEATTAHIVNGSFDYATPTILNCETCQWAYIDLNNTRFAIGNDCVNHSQKWTWIPLFSDFNAQQFGWRSSQKENSSDKWDNGTVACVENCVEVQRERNGNCYAELTASQKNTYIYQDISTEPGTIYKWSLKHASRASNSVDSMSVMIGSISSQSAQNAVRTSVNGLGDKVGNVGTSIATPSSRPYINTANRIDVQWESYAGTYIVPAGQTTTRFTFKALTSSSNTTGNLVDDISFTRSYAVNYDLTGGKSDAIYSDATAQNYAGYHAEGSVVDLTPAKPSRPGYSFIGWSREHIDDITTEAALKAAKQSLITTFTMPATATTIYAVWAKDPVTTFTDGLSTTLSSQCVPFGTGATAPADPERIGYTFKGWDVPFSNVYSDLSVNALWRANTYTVTFNANQGSGSMEDQSFIYGQAQKLSFNRFAREGYLFAGWNTHPDGSGEAYMNEQEVVNLAHQNGSTIALYAQWQPIEYYVAFDAYGGTGVMYDQHLTFDQIAALQPNSFKRVGHRWIGWNTNPSVPETWYEDRALVKNLTERAGEVISLYAIWSANRCLVVFDGNGGTGSMEAQSLAYGTPEKLHPNAFERAGYHWVSWNTQPDGSGDTYTDEETVQDLNTADNSTLILYAIWEKDGDDEPTQPDAPPLPDAPSDADDPTNPDPAEPSDPPMPTDPDDSSNTDKSEDSESDSDPGNLPSAEESDPGTSDKSVSDAETGSDSGTTQDETEKDSTAQAKNSAPFAKTGESIMGIACLALAILAGGAAFIIAGARRRKQALERKRQFFRSRLKP